MKLNVYIFYKYIKLKIFVYSLSVLQACCPECGEVHPKGELLFKRLYIEFESDFYLYAYVYQRNRYNIISVLHSKCSLL